MKQTIQQQDGVRLIEAVQSLSTVELKKAIQLIKRRYPESTKGFRYSRYQSLNAGFGNTGLTALIVACKAYAHHYDDMKLRGIFSNMVSILLSEGADPYFQADARMGECINAITVCNGKLPPSLFEKVRNRKCTALREEEPNKPRVQLSALGGLSEHQLNSPYNNGNGLVYGF